MIFPTLAFSGSIWNFRFYCVEIKWYMHILGERGESPLSFKKTFNKKYSGSWEIPLKTSMIHSRKSTRLMSGRTALYSLMKSLALTLRPYKMPIFVHVSWMFWHVSPSSLDIFCWKFFKRKMRFRSFLQYTHIPLYSQAIKSKNRIDSSRSLSGIYQTFSWRSCMT